MLRFNNFPVLLVYLIFPVSMLAGRELGFDLSRNWIDVAWALYAVVLLMFALVSIRLRVNKSELFWLFLLFMSAVFFLGKWLFALTGEEPSYIPYLMELKPLIYLFVALLIFLVAERIDNNSFVYFGVILALLVISEFIIKSALASEFVLPRVSGERNYDALLLLISFVMLFQNGARFSLIIKILIITGLLLTFSRTALIALVFIVFFVLRVSPAVKLISVVMAAVFFFSSFIIRELPIDAVERMDRYWMWMTAFQVFDMPIKEVLFGFEVGKSIDVIVPEQIRGLWSMQSEAYGLSGVYPFHFHAFWIRIGLTFGVLFSFLLAMLFLRGLLLGKGCVVKGLSAIVLVEGLTMGVFYLGNIAVPLYLVLFSSFFQSRVSISGKYYMHNNAKLGKHTID